MVKALNRRGLDYAICGGVAWGFPMTTTEPSSPSRPNSDDEISSEVIDQRLRSLAGLYRLGMSLKNAKYIGPVEKIDKAEPEGHSPNVNDNSRT